MSNEQGIRRVFVRVHERRYDKPSRNPHVRWDAKYAVLAFVETYGGVLGVGEAWCDSASLRSVISLIEEDLAPAVTGLPVSMPESLWHEMMRREPMNLRGAALYAAASAVDIAVWDAFAKGANLPLYRLLGGFRDSVPVYGSAGLYRDDYGPGDLARDMAGAMERGCFGVKIKVAGASIAEDVARASAVREAIGPEAALMVDALFAPTVPQAIALGRDLSPFGILFFEAPTDRRNPHGWEEIASATGLSLSGPEVEAGLDRFETFARITGLHYLQADAIICGGMTEMRRIASLASAMHRQMTVHCSGSGVAFAANACAAAAFSSGHSVELHLLHQSLYDRVWDAGYRVGEGALTLSDRPGLGLEIEPDDHGLQRTG